MTCICRSIKSAAQWRLDGLRGSSGVRAGILQAQHMLRLLRHHLLPGHCTLPVAHPARQPLTSVLATHASALTGMHADLGPLCHHVPVFYMVEPKDSNWYSMHQHPKQLLPIELRPLSADCQVSLISACSATSILAQESPIPFRAWFISLFYGWG